MMTLKNRIWMWTRHAAWLRIWPGSGRADADEPGEVAQARALVKAVDAGGIPLNPARVNHLARALGLEVSSKAPVDETIERIRQALQRR
jgi:hypothetical protein